MVHDDGWGGVGGVVRCCSPECGTVVKFVRERTLSVRVCVGHKTGALCVAPVGYGCALEALRRSLGDGQV